MGRAARLIFATNPALRRGHYARISKPMPHAPQSTSRNDASGMPDLTSSAPIPNRPLIRLAISSSTLVRQLDRP
eukprot:9484305-Pyramimonas_sp.AAC.1